MKHVEFFFLAVVALSLYGVFCVACLFVPALERLRKAGDCPRPMHPLVERLDSLHLELFPED